ncbi:MAG: hypothetical protein ABI400_02305 [Lacisediminihabitans sp.]
MSSYVDLIVTEVDEALQRATTGLDGLQLHGPGIIRELVNTYLDTFLPVPGVIKNEIANKLIGEMMDVIGYAREAIAVNKKMAHMLGSPDALRAAAQVLDTGVNKVSRDLASSVRPDSLEAMSDDSKWQGGASQLYAKSFTGQSDAVTRIAEYGRVLEATLGKLADAIEQFYAELLVAVLSLVAAILTLVLAILTALGIVTIPIAVVSAIGAILSVLATAASIAAMVMTIMQEVSGSLSDLHSNLQPWPSAKFAS